jgi:uncharacterized protein YwqG
MNMSSDELIERLEPWRNRWMRPGWSPITEDGESSQTASKFGGTPWLSPDESWPYCPHCQTTMPLFLQLNLAELPDVVAYEYGSGLLQVFYCTKCDDGWEPFSKTSVVRIVQADGEGAVGVGNAPPFAAKTVIGWEQFEDFPHPQDHPDLGLTYRYQFEIPLRTTVSCPELAIEAEIVGNEYLAEEISSAETGDKLAGWPCWVQGAEYPGCPLCHQQMRLVFQLDSNDNLPFMWGDMGVGHVTQCPEHKEIVAFGWACS